MTSGTLLSLGSVNADFQVRVDEHPGERPTLLAHDFLRLGGGKAANVAWLARRLGEAAELFARVGDDDLREQALAPLRSAGVGLAHVRSVPGAATAVSMIAVPPDGRKHIVLAPNANDRWTDGDRDRVARAVRAAPDGSVLAADVEVSPAVVEAAVAAARARGFAVVLDPAPADRVGPDLVAGADFIVPDASEAEALTGVAPDDEASALRAAGRLVERGAGAACVRLEDGGCAAATAERRLFVTPIDVESVDATGAGDAFTGAFAVAVLRGRGLVDAVLRGMGAAHACVLGYGSRPYTLAPGRIDAFADRLRERVRESDDDR